MRIERYEVRDGGTWRYVSVGKDGAEYGFHGVFHGVPSPDLMVQTFDFEGVPGHVSLESLVLEDHDGRTLVKVHSVFQSIEDRDGMISSGMESGLDEGYDRLDELLAGMLATAR